MGGGAPSSPGGRRRANTIRPPAALPSPQTTLTQEQLVATEMLLAMNSQQCKVRSHGGRSGHLGREFVGSAHFGEAARPLSMVPRSPRAKVVLSAPVTEHPGEQLKGLKRDWALVAGACGICLEPFLFLLSRHTASITQAARRPQSLRAVSPEGPSRWGLRLLPCGLLGDNSSCIAAKPPRGPTGVCGEAVRSGPSGRFLAVAHTRRFLSAMVDYIYLRLLAAMIELFYEIDSAGANSGLLAWSQFSRQMVLAAQVPCSRPCTPR